MAHPVQDADERIGKPHRLSDTAQSILAVTESGPEHLFSDRSRIEERYRALLMQWHPDRNRGNETEAAKVSAHINVLHVAVKKKVAAGTWSRPGYFFFETTKGTKYEFKVARKAAFDLGEVLYNQQNVCFVIAQEFADLVENARKVIKSLTYPDDKMRVEMHPRLPWVKADYETQDGRQIIIMAKRPDEYLLSDVLIAAGGKFETAHVAWLMNAVYDILCYLHWAGVAHNSISPDSIFISPSMHSASLLGGWWYAKPTGARLNAMSRRAFNIAPPGMRADKKASRSLDRLMIRALGREMLGDIAGMAMDPSVHPKMASFLRGVPDRDAFRDYATWQQSVLPACFGVRRFVKWDFNQSAIYGT